MASLRKACFLLQQPPMTSLFILMVLSLYIQHIADPFSDDYIHLNGILVKVCLAAAYQN